jgi:hypothetical protein
MDKIAELQGRIDHLSKQQADLYERKPDMDWTAEELKSFQDAQNEMNATSASRHSVTRPSAISPSKAASQAKRRANRPPSHWARCSPTMLSSRRCTKYRAHDSRLTCLT